MLDAPHMNRDLEVYRVERLDHRVIRQLDELKHACEYQDFEVSGNDGLLFFAFLPRQGVVGCCSLSDNGGSEYTVCFMTLPEYRRQGVAATMVSYLQRRSTPDVKIDSLSASVDRPSVAEGILAKAGFRLFERNGNQGIYRFDTSGKEPRRSFQDIDEINSDLVQIIIEMGITDVVGCFQQINWCGSVLYAYVSPETDDLSARDAERIIAKHFDQCFMYSNLPNDPDVDKIQVIISAVEPFMLGPRHRLVMFDQRLYYSKGEKTRMAVVRPFEDEKMFSITMYEYG